MTSVAGVQQVLRRVLMQERWVRSVSACSRGPAGHGLGISLEMEVLLGTEAHTLTAQVTTRSLEPSLVGLVNADAGEGMVDWAWLNARPRAEAAGCVYHLRFDEPALAVMDGRDRHGVIVKPGAGAGPASTGSIEG